MVYLMQTPAKVSPLQFLLLASSKQNKEIQTLQSNLNAESFYVLIFSFLPTSAFIPQPRIDCKYLWESGFVYASEAKCFGVYVTNSCLLLYLIDLCSI